MKSVYKRPLIKQTQGLVEIKQQGLSVHKLLQELNDMLEKKSTNKQITRSNSL
tara:strand:+ start:764 stop:922 length:159 start_codon:yes stop_codon:yes gene_type:complete